MIISSAGVAFIKSWESCRLEAYPDAVWGWEIPTIGWGHTSTLDCELGTAPGQGQPIKQGDVITQPVADCLLTMDIDAFSDQVTSLLRVQLTQGKFDALVSFAFNNGIGAFHGSTLLGLVNQRNFAMASLEFPKWCHAGRPPVVVAGLLKRRRAEEAMFVKG
jgi:lysozyme